MVKSSILGFPRIGANRELKKATESYWQGKISTEELLVKGKEIRITNWNLQKNAGVDIIPSNDFSFYDQVLDLCLLFNVIPVKYTQHGLSKMDTLFAMGRGLQRAASKGNEAIDLTALEMVKWFDSNYHYVRPTFSQDTQFRLNTEGGLKPLDEYNEAKAIGIETRPVLLGPISFLYLGKADKDSADLDVMSLIIDLVPIYKELLVTLKEAGVIEVQMDEPILVLDLAENIKTLFKTVYEDLVSEETPGLILTTYFGDVRPNLSAIRNLPVAGFHFDFVRTPDQLNEVISILNESNTLSIGIVDARNIWKANLSEASEFVENAINKLDKDRVIVSTSSSLMHIPVDLKNEVKMHAMCKDWFSFATQKVTEVVAITGNLNGDQSVDELMVLNSNSIHARRYTLYSDVSLIQSEVADLDESFFKRKSPFNVRKEIQNAKYGLPLLPTTTIGSFPQTKEIRAYRNKLAMGECFLTDYNKFIHEQIRKNIEFQLDIGLDVLVHGEPERNDMVQYFAEKMSGFLFTTNGWVQSYGTRYVRPPIIHDDIDRSEPMSVSESVYAQSLTTKPVKGMLTGPVTCLRWSFPRNDLPYDLQAYQLALALRKEVQDLEKAGITVIQVDEPALREGLPLREGTERAEYLKWAARSFRLATSGVADETQIHSHFCYSDLDPSHIKALDADVVSIEFSKKDDPRYIQEFADYPNHIGLGLFDIHSPRIPSKEEFISRILEILKIYPAEKFWVNPDCGLKTRSWTETRESLKNMADAAIHIRELQKKI